MRAALARSTPRASGGRATRTVTTPTVTTPTATRTSISRWSPRWGWANQPEGSLTAREAELAPKHGDLIVLRFARQLDATMFLAQGLRSCPCCRPLCNKSTREGEKRGAQEVEQETVHLQGAVFRNPVARVLQTLDAQEVRDPETGRLGEPLI